MKKILVVIFSVLIFALSYGEDFLFPDTLNSEKIFINKIPQNTETIIDESQYMFLYHSFGLEDKLNYKIFKMALRGYSKVKERKKKYLVIADYSKPSSEKRFFILNMNNFSLEDYTYVAHGKNSGADMAVSFSNKMNSYKSSLGFYLTGKSYTGRYGYSLRLFGLEEGYNSNAFKRGVVVHGASASEPEYIKKYGFLGRTEGCPAVPKSLNRKIIDKIKDGSVLFIYGNDNKYLRDSKFIR